MKDHQSSNSWQNLPPEVQAQILEKREYERRLGDLLEDIRQAALGIDYQTKVHLKQIEKRVMSKLMDTEFDIKRIIKDYRNNNLVDKKQGKLFDE